MPLMKRDPKTGRWYDVDIINDHLEKDENKLRDNRNKQKIYRQEKKDSDGYKQLHSRKWRKFRKDIIRLDNGFCQRCLYKYGIYNHNNLEVHHIKPREEFPELVFDEDNVITLCKTCNLELGLNGIDFDWKPSNRIHSDEIYFNWKE